MGILPGKYEINRAQEPVRECCNTMRAREPRPYLDKNKMVPNSPECFVYPYCQGRGGVSPPVTTRSLKTINFAFPVIWLYGYINVKSIFFNIYHFFFLKKLAIFLINEGFLGISGFLINEGFLGISGVFLTPKLSPYFFL